MAVWRGSLGADLKFSVVHISSLILNQNIGPNGLRRLLCEHMVQSIKL